MGDRPERNSKGQFLQGVTGNVAGRPRGARTKLGEAFAEALHADFEVHGVETIERVRNEDPAAYVRVIAGLLPKEMKVETSSVNELSDDELGRLIDVVRAADGASVSARSGESPSGRTH